MNDKTLEIFGPTIYIRWNAQSAKLKDDLTNHFAILFGDTFNKKEVISIAGTYLKYVHDQCRAHLQNNPRYERSLMITEREWRDLIDDSKGKILRK